MRWTEEEIEYLHDNIGLQSYEELSKTLNRSKEAIELFRCRHKLPKLLDNVYTFKILSKELGKSKSSIRKYYYKGWLKGKRASWTYLYKNAPIIFLEEHIVKFLRAKYYLFTKYQIPNPYFRNIVKKEQLKCSGLRKAY